MALGRQTPRGSVAGDYLCKALLSSVIRVRGGISRAHPQDGRCDQDKVENPEREKVGDSPSIFVETESQNDSNLGTGEQYYECPELTLIPETAETDDGKNYGEACHKGNVVQMQSVTKKSDGSCAKEERCFY